MREELATRRVTVRLDRHPMAFLVIPVLHLRGYPVMVHVERGRATPDVYVWDHGHQRHPVADPAGAAAWLLGYLEDLGSSDHHA